MLVIHPMHVMGKVFFIEIFILIFYKERKCDLLHLYCSHSLLHLSIKMMNCLIGLLGHPELRTKPPAELLKSELSATLGTRLEQSSLLIWAWGVEVVVFRLLIGREAFIIDEPSMLHGDNFSHWWFSISGTPNSHEIHCSCIRAIITHALPDPRPVIPIPIQM